MLFFILFLPHLVIGGYAPLIPPPTWKFGVKTLAYDPNDPSKELGSFRKDLVVTVIKALPDTDHWLVEYKTGMSKPVRALIDTPDLSVALPFAFDSTKSMIEGFPVLEKQLSHDTPWPDTAKTLATRLFGDIANSKLIGGTDDNPDILRAGNIHGGRMVWGSDPLVIDCDYSNPQSPKIIIELWNKADRGVASPHKVKSTIENNLKKIEAAFETRPSSRDQKSKSSGIAAVKNSSTLYYLPNDIIASLRYKRDQYLLLEFKSFSRSQSKKAHDADTFKETILSHVKKDDKGNHYISSIPMISQGNKGYCVAATLARVLNYYGYQVDMHSMADLAETSAYGTTKKDVLDSIRRICNGTPFRMQRLDEHKIYELQKVLDQGIPILWIVPGHIRLLIGYNPDSNDIVYSDSWGAGHEFKTMKIDEYFNMSIETWILNPKE